MSTRRRVLCKFFANGSCLKGEYCNFSHDWSDLPNNVCTFYQKGRCFYGSRCRYDHVKVCRNQTSTRSSLSNSSPHVPTTSLVVTDPSGVPLDDHNQLASSNCDLSASSQPSDSLLGLNLRLKSCTPHDVDSNSGPSIIKPADMPLCPFTSGSCPRGESCHHVHGDVCSICEKNCLHPYRPEESEEHIKLCQKNKKHLEALKYSLEIECSICLEHVYSKPTAAERKFGLLSECDHPFCISCIRNWRNSSPDSGLDLNNALRSCPVCRKHSYFVIPSVTWYSTKEEKQDIIDSYKAKLKSIDCKYFENGFGSCPFGASCFYKHAFKPHANRQGNRHQRYRSRSSQSMPSDIEELENLFSQLLADDELDDLADDLFSDNYDPDYFDDVDFAAEDFDDDVDSLLAMSFLLSQFSEVDNDGYETASDDELAVT